MNDSRYARDHQATVRLLIVLLYVVVISPGYFFIRRRLEARQIPTIFFAVSAIALLAFVVLEIFEYVSARRGGLGRATAWTVLGARLAIVAGAIAITSVERGEFLLSPELSSLVPLMAFYIGLMVRSPTSVIVLAVAFAVPLGIVPELWRGASPPEAVKVGFVLFRFALVLVFFFLAWFLRSEQEQRRRNSQLVKELAESRETIRSYAEQVGITVALEERTRLAREIHDSIGHALTAITIQLTKAERYRTVDPTESAAAIAAAQKTAREAMDDVRQSIGSLNGTDRSIDIREAITKLTRNLEQSDITASVGVDGEPEGYNYAVLIGVYRFVQEAITNVLKHAAAKQVVVSATFGTKEATVSVADDGRGFLNDGVISEATLRGATTRTGLVGLRHRLELVRGQLEIHSAPGEGTTLVATVPRNPLAVIGEGADR